MLYLCLAVCGVLAGIAIGLFYIKKKKLGEKKTNILFIGLTAAVMLTVFFLEPPSVETVRFYWLLPLMCLIAVEDWKSHIISNRLLLCLLVFGVAANALLPDYFISSLLGLLVYGGILVLVSLITKGSFGMGDAKLSGVIGLFYGMTATFAVVFTASVAAAVVGIIILIMTHDRKKEIPFAPAILIGCLIALAVVL